MENFFWQYNRLKMFLEKYNSLYKHQNGFRSKTSTVHPILYFARGHFSSNDKIAKDFGCVSGPFKSIWYNEP